MNLQEDKHQELTSLGISLPMAISCLDDFEVLDSKLIKSQLSTLKSHHSLPKLHTVQLSSNNSIQGQNNFSLLIDQDFIEQHSFLRIANCSKFEVRGFLHEIKLKKNHKFFIEICECNDFLIGGIACSGGRLMLLVTGSSSFTIKNCSCSDANGAGLTLHNSHSFKITHCFFNNNLAAAILIIGNCFNGNIQDSTCSRSRGYFNHDAGIHLCSTSKHVFREHVPNLCHEEISIANKTEKPHHILIKNCVFSHSRAQGIYLEGAVNCIIEQNIILGNNKEGICIDWGSCYNILTGNTIAFNGERRKLSEKEIQTDFISRYPLLEDGSSSMKLPGISLDNGCHNLLQDNKISNNSGGGIKMIRSSMFNTIIKNEIRYNALGANRYIAYYHGVTALGLSAINNEFESTKSRLLDFLPSILNTITDNTIAEHWSPFYFDKVSKNNYLSNNLLPKNLKNHSLLRITASRVKAFILRSHSQRDEE